MLSSNLPEFYQPANTPTTMKLALPLTVGIFGCVLVAVSAVAQLPTRSDLLKKNYDADRVKGLTALNQRYIEAFENELELALKSTNLEEANGIQLQIQSLKAEIIELEKSANKDADLTGEAKPQNALVGKTVGFPQTKDSTDLVYVSFQEDGKARWLGSKNQSVERAYKKRGGDFIVWWPARPTQMTYDISVNADGKTAKVKMISTGEVVDGIIEPTK